MLEILMYAFPTMVLIVGAYLLLYRETLITVLKIESSRLIIMFALTYFVLAVLGFLLTLMKLETFVYLWIIFVVLFTFFMVFVFYKIHEANHKQ